VNLGEGTELFVDPADPQGRVQRRASVEDRNPLRLFRSEARSEVVEKGSEEAKERAEGSDAEEKDGGIEF